MIKTIGNMKWFAKEEEKIKILIFIFLVSVIIVREGCLPKFVS